jgi:hypothetical protein
MKTLLFSFVWAFIFVSSVFAQSSGNIVNIKPSIPTQFMEQLQNVGVRFCDQWMTEKTVTSDFLRFIRPGQSKEICIWFFNSSDKPINIVAWFSEASLSWWKFVCESEFVKKNDFLNRFRQDWVWKIITVSPKSNIIKKAYFYSDSLWSGDEYWCLVYKIAENDSAPRWTIFNVIMRQAISMKFTITWDVYNLQWWDDIKYDVKNNINDIMKIVIVIIVFLLWVEIVKMARSKKKSKH